MNDIEFEFQKDCKQKKNIGKSSKYKKGRGGKYCRLPSDNLTERQWKKMNGEIESINLTKQMDWNEFRELNKSLQEEYLRNLIEKYGARQSDIARMFCRRAPTVCMYIKENKLDVNFPKNGEKKENPKWRDFIEGRAIINQVLEKEKKGLYEKDEPVDPVAEIRKEAKELGIEPKKEKTAIRNIAGRISMEGKPAAVLERIYKTLDNQKEYSITIVFLQLDEEN